MKLFQIYHYGKGGKIPFKQEMSKILIHMEQEKHPYGFKHQLLSCVQLYFDGLIDAKKNPDDWERQHNTLEMLCQNGIEYIGRYYNGEGENIDDIKQNILEKSSELTRLSRENIAKKARLNRHERKIKNILKSPPYLENKDINIIVPVASEGFEPGFLSANILGINKIVPLRFSHHALEDTKVMIPKNTPEDYMGKIFRDKNILVVEGSWIHGISMRNVINYVKKHSPNLINGLIVHGAETMGYGHYDISSKKKPTIFQIR